MIIYSTGAVTTLLVAAVISSMKFLDGAWIVVLLIPLLVLMFLGIYRHYQHVERDPEDTLTMILPEFVVAHWWEYLLHNQTAFRLKASLLFRPGIVVTDIP
jgi:hypothetical protein